MSLGHAAIDHDGYPGRGLHEMTGSGDAGFRAEMMEFHFGSEP